MSPQNWPDAERKKALIRRHAGNDAVALFLIQWIEYLERRIKKLEHKEFVNSVIPSKPKPRP